MNVNLPRLLLLLVAGVLLAWLPGIAAPHARADQAAAPVPTPDPTVIFEIFEPGSVPPEQENRAVGYDPSRPLLVVRNVQDAALASDGLGVYLRLTPTDAKLLASLSRVYLGKFLIMKTANNAGQVLAITSPIEDGVLRFDLPVQAPIAAFLRERLKLTPP